MFDFIFLMTSILEQLGDLYKYLRFNYIPQYIFASRFSNQAFYFSYKLLYGTLNLLLSLLSVNFREKHQQFKRQIYPNTITNDYIYIKKSRKQAKHNQSSLALLAILIEN